MTKVLIIFINVILFLNYSFENKTLKTPHHLCDGFLFAANINIWDSYAEINNYTLDHCFLRSRLKYGCYKHTIESFCNSLWNSFCCIKFLVIKICSLSESFYLTQNSSKPMNALIISEDQLYAENTIRKEQK